jgi:predicted RND superfamily exporter protein
VLFLSRISAGRPLVCLVLVVAATLALATRLPRLELRTDGAVLHPAGDPAVERTAQDRLTFEDPEELIVLLTSRPGGESMVSAAGLRSLSHAQESVASLPGVRSGEVRSAASLVDVASSDVASLGTFLDEIPDDASELGAMLRRMRELPWTDGLFLSADGSAAAIYAPLEPGQDRRQRVEELGRWAQVHAEAGLDLRLTGPVIAETLLGERILDDLTRLVPVMILVVALLLLVCLRTPGGVLVAMSKTLVVLVWTGGLAALAAVPVTLVTTILPVLLTALCVTDEVHVIARLQAKLQDGGTGSVKSELLSTLRELYRPVVYTSISTAIGFLSFLSASILPMRHFGALTALGILLSMLMTFTLTPALVVLLPGSWFLPRGPGRGTRRPRILHEGLAGRRRTIALVVGLLLLAAGLPGLLRLSVQDSWIENFDPDSPLVRAEQEFNSAFWGTYRFDLVLTGPPGFFHRPEGVALVERAARIAADAPHAGGVVTFLEPLDTVAELLGLSAGVSALPADALKAVVEVAAAYRRQTGLDRLVTPDGRAARILLVVNSPDYRRSRALAMYVDRELASLVEEREVSYHASGDIPLAVATVGAIVDNQLRSIAWTLVGIAVLLGVVNRNLRLTLTQLVPPAAAAWLILSGMGYAGLSLGIATSMFTALTLGVGVDLALHVTYAYEHGRCRGLEAADAVRGALESTAAGRRWSTAVLSLGFLVLSASAFGPNHDLGLLLCAAMLTSYLTTYLFVPRMLA